MRRNIINFVHCFSLLLPQMPLQASFPVCAVSPAPQQLYQTCPKLAEMFRDRFFASGSRSVCCLCSSLRKTKNSKRHLPVCVCVLCVEGAMVLWIIFFVADHSILTQDVFRLLIYSLWWNITHVWVLREFSAELDCTYCVSPHDVSSFWVVSCCLIANSSL